MIIAIDFETALTDGTPSLDYYRPDFRAVSAAAAVRYDDGDMHTEFLDGEAAIERFLAGTTQTLIVHNAQFEHGVLKHRFPGHESRIAWDTMRLAQVADNGGLTGLGLQACVKRWLPMEHHDHKAEYHTWLRENAGAKKGKEGQHLTSLPPDMLREYNIKDAVVTLRLYERLTEFLASLSYDPSLDHALYLSSARLASDAKARGARVNREALEAYVKEIDKEVLFVETSFRERFAVPIASIEGEARTYWLGALKTPQGQLRRFEALADDVSLFRFNLGSNQQLEALFVGSLGIAPKFWTKPAKGRDPETFTPQPSFKAAHLSTYGEGGEMLVRRRKRLLVKQQAEALLALSEHDGAWHPDLRVAGTATGRMAGGGGE